MRGFTLIEVLVALVVVAIGLGAMMITVSSTARTSGALRDKTQAQWIALNRLSEVRLKLTPAGTNTDKGELNFANHTWHYDTRYFDTSIASMKRIVVRVYAGDSKTKGNALAEATGFIGNAMGSVGSSNVDWTQIYAASQGGASTTGTTPTTTTTNANPTTPIGTTTTPTPTPAPTPTPSPSPQVQ